MPYKYGVQPQEKPSISDDELEKVFNQARIEWRKKHSEEIEQTLLETSVPEVAAASTVVGRIFDILSRGEYASANLAKDYIMGKDFDMGSAWRGLKGEEKTTYDDLVPVVFKDWSPWKQKAMSFALAIFADPTTYIPSGTLAKPLGLLSETKAGIKAAKVLDESILAKAFKPGAGLPKAYYETKYYARKALESENQAILRDIEKLRGGLSKKDMERLSFFRENPNAIDQLEPHLHQKLSDIGDRFDALIDDAYRSGLIDDEQMAKWMGRKGTYLYHHYPARGLQLARGEIPPSLFEKVKNPTFLKKRSFETIEDAKALSADFADVATSRNMDEALQKIEKHGLEDAFSKGQYRNFDELKSVAQRQSDLYKPEENILKLLAYRRLEQAGYKARRNFVENVLEQFGHRVRYDTTVVPEGMGLYLPKGRMRFYVREGVDADHIEALAKEYGDLIPLDKLEGFLKKNPHVTKKVPLYMMDESIAKDMQRANKFFSDPATNWMMRFFDKGQNAWKVMATTVRLPFHLRNMYSNWWQAYLSGLNNPKRFADALAFQSGKLESIKLGNTVYKYADLKKIVDELGIHGKGWIGSDIQKSMLGELDSIIKYGKFRKLNPVNAGRMFGTAIEDNSRIAVFFDQLAKGKTPQEASQTVRKYLFDYSELTDFEKKVMRRIFPFYTWTRKNSMLQLENLIRQPRKYQAWMKGLRAFAEPETPEEARLKPKYFNELLYVKSPFTTEQGKPMYMAIDLPPLEFNRISSMRHWISSMSPYKLIFELGLNFKTFPEVSEIKKRPLDYGRAPFWVAYLPNTVQQFMKKHHVITPIVNKRNGSYELGMDKKWIHALQSAFPFTNELNRVYAQPITLDDESPEMKWKSYITGISHSAISMPLQQERELWRKMEHMNNVKGFAAQTGRPPNEEEFEMLESNE